MTAIKALLMRPPAPNLLSRLKIISLEPLELEYLYTVLAERGHEAVIYDGITSRKSARRVLIDTKPQIVAITGYITQQDLIIKYAKLAKKLNPSVITIVGGVHAQLNFSSFYDCAIDYIFRSEDVNAFGRLIDSLSRSDIDIERISGLCYRREGGYIENSFAPFDISTLPIPDRSYFYAHRRQFRYLDLTETAIVKTAISCPFDCKFCYCACLGGGRYSVRPLDMVMAEIEGLDCESIMIADDVFLVDKIRVTAFIKEIRARNIRKRFICYSRADFIAQNPELVSELVKIGFFYFLVGLEAFCDNELVSYNKGITADVNIRCVRVIKKAGGRCYALMIVPIDADKAYFSALYDWIVKHEIRYATVSIFTPIPGTPMYDEYRNKITSKKPRHWDFLHLVMKPEKMSRAGFYLQFFKLSYKIYRLAKKTGIFDFMTMKYYRETLLNSIRRR